MYKSALNFLAFLLFITYIGLIFILPFKWYHFGPYSEIFPAFDLIIIYYLCTYLSMKNLPLFIVGFLIDQLYHIPLGSSSLSLILANLLLNQIGTKFILKNYITNLAIFCLYSFFLIIIRYLIVSVQSKNYIEGIDIFFYYLTTIFSYPVLLLLIEYPIKKITNYVK